MNAAQARMARAALQWKVEDVAEKAGLSRMTIMRLEGEQVRPNRATLAVLRQTFEAAGVEFIGDTGVHVRPPPPADGPMP